MLQTAHTEKIAGKVIQLRATVALLTRNIRIEGLDYPLMQRESFGARILVGQGYFNRESHSGGFLFVVCLVCMSI